jgi:hypothetical protein
MPNPSLKEKEKEYEYHNNKIQVGFKLWAKTSTLSDK